MPLYEYECDNCGHKFEKIRSVHDEPLTQCPNCANNTLRKIFHPAGIIFKGSGWYINDSRNASAGSPSSSSANKSESKGDSKNESKGETKSDSKTESKSDSQGGTQSESKTETKTESKSNSDSKQKT